MRHAVSPVFAGWLADVGQVVIAIAVRSDGRVERTKVVKPEDAPDWYQKRIERELAQCQFEPGKDSRGTPLRMWVILPVRYAKDP